MSWTAPTHTGGSAVTGYSVAVSANSGAYAAAAGGTCTSASTSTSTSCTVTGLTEGRTYAFKVTPINANGNGTQSEASSSITAYGDLAKFAVTATDQSALGTQTAGTSFDIRITAQDSDGRTVTNFTGTVDVTSTSLFSAGSGTTAAFTAGVLSSHAVTLVRAGTSQTVTATRTSGGSETGSSAAFTINADTATKVQVLLPGETAAPGTVSGKTGTATDEVAGTGITATVNAVDANWNVVSSATQTITITSSDGAATLPSNAALVSGTKDFSVTLKTAGAQTITATVASGTSLTAGTSASVTVTAAAASKLVVGAIGSQTAGAGFPVTVTLTDTYGNAVNNTGATGTVTLTRGSGSGTVGGTVSGTIAVGASAVTISGVTYSKAESGVTLTATGTGASSLVNGKTGTSGAFAVTSGAATSYAVSLSSATPTVGGTVTVTAQLEDANGNAVATSGKTVTWSASASGGSFASATSTTNASGVATVIYTVPTTSGVLRTITATDNTALTGTSSALTTQVGSATASQSTLTASSSSVTANGSTVTLTVQAKDQYGNNLGAGGSTVVISRASGTGTVGLVTDNGNGTYTATLTAPTATGSGVFSATLGGSAVEGGTGSTQTVLVTYTSGTATKLVITGSASQTAGASQDLTITAQDANGNTATAYTGDKTLTFTGASQASRGQMPAVKDNTGTTVVFGTLTTITFSNGVATVSSGNNGAMTLYKAESATVSVTDGTISSAGSDQLSVTVSAGSASLLAMATQPVAGASGSALSTQPVVSITDAYGNATTSTATVTVTASGGTLGGSQASSGVAAVSGTATFTNLTFAGLTTTSRTLTFASSGLTSVTSGSITPSGAGAAASIAVNAGNAQSATVNTAVSTAPSVLVTDAAGNPVSGVSVTFAAASGGGSVVGAGATTNASGVATVTSWTLGTTAGANTLTATSGSLSGSPVTFTATATPGTAATLAITGSASQNALSSQDLTITARDSFGNTATAYTGSKNLVFSGASATSGGTAPTVTNASGIAVDFGSTTPITFTSGVASVSGGANGVMTLYKAESATISASDGTISSGANTLAVTVSRISQSALTMTSASTVVYGASLTLTSSGGSGSGSVSYAVTAAGTAGCSISGSTLTATGAAGTTCGVTATKAADDSYSSVSSPQQTITVTTASLTVTADTVAINFGQTPTFGVTGSALVGSDALSGATYTFAGTGSTSYGPSTTAPTAVGTYSITPSAATFSPGSASNYSIIYADGTLTISKANQAALTFASTSATLGGSTTLSVSGGSGTGAVTYTLVSAGTASCSLSGAVLSYTSGGTCTISATKADDASYNSQTTGSVTFTVNGPSTVTSTLSAASTSLVANGSATTTITVTLKDSSGTIVAADAATVTLAASDGTIGTVVYAGNGSYTAVYTAPSTVGSATISGALNGVAMTATETITLVAGPAAQVIVVTSPVAGASGATLATQPVVRIADAAGNTITNSTASVTVSAGTGTLSGTTTVSASSGIATFTGLSFAGLASTTHTLTFASSGLTSATASIQPTGAGAAATIAVNAGNGQTAVAGSAVATAPSVLVTDSGGNPVSGRSITFAVASGAGTVVGGSATTNSSGVAALTSWTLGTTAGANTLTAESSGLAGSPITFTATGTAGAVTKFAVTMSGGTTALSAAAKTAGTPFSVRVTAQDANGNTNADWTGSVSLTSTSWTGTVTADISANGYVDGVAVTPTIAGTSRMVTAASGAITTASASSTFTVNPGAHSSFTITNTSGGVIPTQVAGTSFAIKIVAVDAYGNTVTSFTGTTTLTSSRGTVLTGSTTSSFSAGVLSSHFLSVSASGSQRITATSSGPTVTGMSAAFSVTAGAVSKLVLNTTPSSSSASGTVLGRQPVLFEQDAYSNVSTNGPVNVSAIASSTVESITGIHSGYPAGLTYGGGRWVLAAACEGFTNRTCVYLSADGASWSQVLATLNGTPWAAGYGGGAWLVTTETGAYRSTDGLTWTRGSTNLSTWTQKSVAYGNGVWVSVGSNVSWRSSDGGNQWSTITDLNNRMLESVIYANGMFLASGSGGMFSSANGTSWTQLSGAQQWLAYGAGVYVSAGYNQSGSTVRVRILYSTNPSAGWTEVRSVQSIDCAPRAVAWSGTQFVVGGNGCFFTSTDGINWSGGASQTAPPMTVAAGGNGMVLSSYQPSQLNRIYDSIAGTTTVTPSAGTATFTDLAISGPVGTTRTLSYLGSTVGSGSATPLSPEPSSSSVTITSAGPAYRLLLTRASVGTASGAAFTTQPQITVADLAGNTRTSDNSTVVTATASSGASVVGTATATAVNGVATFTDLGLSGTAGSRYEITYSSGSLAAASQIITVTRASQTVTFGAGPGTLTYGDAPFTVSATSTSGEAVTFSSLTSSVCSVSGSTVTIITAGTCTIRGSVAQTGSYNAATADQSYTINQASQAALTLTSTSGTYGTSLTLATSGGTTAGSVTYGVTSGTASGCTVTSGALTSTSAGTCVVTATMAGNTNYSAVSSSATTVTLATRPITLTAADQAIVFGASLSESYSLAPGSLAGSDAIGSVTYTYTGTGSTSYGPSSTKPTGVGTYSVTPSAAVFSSGSASNYSIQYAAGTVTIGQASQTISFANPAPSGATYLDPAIPVSPSASSGLAVTLTSADTSVCQVSSTAVTIVGAGTCSITASQAGSTNYAAASPVTRTFMVSPANQATLTITSPSTATYGESITLATSGGSGTGTVAFGVTAGTCAVAGTTLTLGDAGSLCRVQATKVSDANYNSTTSSAQTITISRAGQVVSFTSSVPASPLPNGTYTPTATSISTVTGSSTGLTPSFSIRAASSSICSINAGVVTFLATGACIIDANSGLTTNFTAAATTSQTIMVGSLNQNITFAQPSSVAFGSSSVSMGATASSGLTVSYALGSGTTGYGTAGAACSVSSLGVVTVLAVGTCEVVASQAGDAQYAAASDVSRAFQVVPALATAPTLTSASASSQSITVGFTAPGFTGGVGISAYQVVATPVGAGSTVTSSSCTVSPCTITGLANGTAYTVTVAAINAAGTGPASSASGSLTPATAAYAVGALAAIPGNTTVTLTWTALTNAQLGGGSFTRYEISMRPAGSSSWNLVSNALTSQSADNLTIPGLSNGTNHDFQVVAITSANASEIPGNTAQVVQYASTVPSAPRSLAVLASTATDVQVSWQAPMSDGGAVLISPYYSVSLTSTTAGATTPVTCAFASATDRFCTATGLTNGAVYAVSVAAINRMGTGAAASTTYSVPSSDATLSNLEVESAAGPVALTPSFASGTTSYTASVATGVSSVTVTPTTTMAGSTVEVDGVAVVSGTASASIPLAVGPNVITVEVTASDVRFDETYTVTITRAAPTGGGSGPADREGQAKLPVTPPTVVASGAQAGAVLVDGEVQSGVVLVRNGTDSGWNAIAEGFTMSIRTESPVGAPERLASNGAMQVPVGGRIVVNGTDYLPGSDVNVFAVPRDSGASGFGSTRVAHRLSVRAAAGSFYIGSAPVSGAGSVSATFTVPVGLDLGAYVLQVNGVTATDQIRSVNMLLDVLPGAPKMRAMQMREAAFYVGGSAQFSDTGRVKLREMVAAVPKDAKNVRVSVVGVSVSQDSPRANLELARERAQGIVDELQASGVKGSYTVSVSTTFDIRDTTKATDAGVESAASAATSLNQPMTSSSGKPLTTVTISFDAPGP